MTKGKASKYLKIKREFKDAVAAYRALIIESFYCRRGAEPDHKPVKQKVIDLFKKSLSSPPEFREGLLFILLYNLPAPVPVRNTRLNDSSDAAMRLKNWLRDLADELVKELTSK
jgi:hypothetical protein